jgi:hypothetical protein
MTGLAAAMLSFCSLLEWLTVTLSHACDGMERLVLEMSILASLVRLPDIEPVDRDGMGGLTAAMFLVCIEAAAPVEGIQTFV